MCYTINTFYNIKKQHVLINFLKYLRLPVLGQPYEDNINLLRLYYKSYIRAIPEHLVNFYSKNITTCSGVAPTFFAPPFVATNAQKQNLNSLSLVAFLILAKKDVQIFLLGFRIVKSKIHLAIFIVYTYFTLSYYFIDSYVYTDRKSVV